MPATIEELRQRLANANTRCRAIWWGDDGKLRCGHSGDMVAMLDHLRKPTHGG